MPVMFVLAGTGASPTATHTVVAAQETAWRTDAAGSGVWVTVPSSSTTITARLIRESYAKPTHNVGAPHDTASNCESPETKVFALHIVPASSVVRMVAVPPA